MTLKILPKALILPNPNIASVYIHWPFCKKLCNYCNFNKYSLNNYGDSIIKEMGQCLLKESLYLLEKAKIKKIHTIYFGGGTPSLMQPVLVKVKYSVAVSFSDTIYIQGPPRQTLQFQKLILPSYQHFSDV